MKKIAPLFSILMLVTFFSQMIYACGPFTLDPYFQFTKHPDYPLENYAGGKLGILQPTFARSYLYAAYRQLYGGDFSEQERRELNDYWIFRITNGDLLPSAPKKAVAKNDAAADNDATGKWLEARKKIVGKDTEISLYGEKTLPGEEYQSFTNCLPDAFNSAAKTLAERVAKYGAESADVKNWIAAQDQVFNNCSADKADIPAAPDANAAEWLRADRNYQRAAALFYALDLPAARAEFEKIAADKNSVWHQTANFVIARTYLRQAAFTKDAAERRQFLEQADAEFEKITKNAELSEFQQSAEGLRGYIRYQLQSAKSPDEAAKALLDKRDNPDLKIDLKIYTKSLDGIKTEMETNAAKDESKENDYYNKIVFKFLPDTAHRDPMTDWIFAFESEDADSLNYSVKKWRETSRDEWLLSAISKAGKNTPESRDLVAAADKIPASAPAYATAAYHEIRVNLEMGDRTAAKRKLLEVFNQNFQSYPVSTQNQFLAERAATAENLDEYLKFAARRAAAFVWSDDGNQQGEELNKQADGADYNDKQLATWKNREMFDIDAVKFFNRKTPLSVMREAALNKNLPAHLQKFLTLAVWTRAFVLKNDQIEREFAPLVLRFAPEYQTLFAKYANAADPSEREAAALNAILNYPKFEPFVEVGFGREDGTDAVTIDSNRGNWWCANFSTNDEQNDEGQFVSAKDTQIYPAFLTASQTAENEREQAQLSKAGNSASYLANRAIAFATANPNHPNAPEILHLAVRATRYGCTDADTLKASKAAFTLLHTRYPNSEWTKKTPYWFGQ